MLPLTPQPSPCACLEVPSSGDHGRDKEDRDALAQEGSLATDGCSDQGHTNTDHVVDVASECMGDATTIGDAAHHCDHLESRGTRISAPGRFEGDRDPCYFERLPVEVTTRIFGFLRPIEDALPLLARVNRRWRKILLNTPKLWREIHVRSDDYSPLHYTVLSIIFRVYGAHVRELTWQTGSRVYESLFCLIPKLTSLTVLRLPILWNKWVVDQLAPLTRLEELQINGGFGLTDSDLARIAGNFPGLRRVVLSSCWAVTAKGVEGFLESLPQLAECKLKINEGLPLCDMRSDFAMLQGSMVTRSVGNASRASTITVLSLNFVPVEMEEVWGVVNCLPRLKKLSISNCEGLQGVRLHSSSLQKIYLLNLWSVHFVSINAPSLRFLRVDTGLESNEHLEVFAGKLRTLQVDGSGVLRTLTVRGGRLTTAEIRRCPVLDPRSFRSFFLENPFLTDLLLGCVCGDELVLDHIGCPSLERVILQGDFACGGMLLRCPNLRVIQTAEEIELPALRQVIIVADHLLKVSLVGLPGLSNVMVQCDSLEHVEANMCSDDALCLRSFVVHATRYVGFMRLFDCSIGALMLSTPCAHTVVLYRCQISDYSLKMALSACPNIVHLSVEKCDTLTSVCVPSHASSLKYLNLFGCKSLARVTIDCHGVAAVNLGQCLKTRLFVRGLEYDLAMHPLKYPKIVLPHQSLRWSHDRVPQLFTIAM
ncbi:uncharacterized protein LOC110982187 [Acanthaster planci]|uniref:Uncharacterized protein LOC110982187 n=1 Tax=Acanthaster planci TaxID=133434 RepID=A0A8B7YUI1_ACAPL|nr:uncharacterized protein LOC110982187 [Acanthaster planci]